MHSIHKFRKNKKGFSLIELIIVVAIMVALTAVLAPAYLKYVKNSRDTVVINAANDVCEFCKSEFADMNLSGKGTIKIGRDDTNHFELTFSSGNTLKYKGKTGDDALSEFIAESGFDSSKVNNSDLVYLIKIDGTIITAPELEVETKRESD